MRGLGRGCVRRRQNDLKHTEPNGKTYRRVRPQFQRGTRQGSHQQITYAIEAAGGVKLLDVDPGEATNRTVVTFVGEPEAVLEAAFAGVKKAAEVIDMRHHKGAHPRMGATDVCPLIPIAGITLEECAELARQLAERIADELHVPTYCYEAAAFTPERRNLAVCRAGEYEALPEKMTHKEAPDFGARPFDEGVARTGATAVGARDFLIAVNFNLNTTSTRRANAIAFDVREKGRPVREGNPLTGKVVKDAAGNPVMKPGTLKATKAIGWFIDEYRHRPGFDEHHQHFRHAAPRGLRRGLPRRQRTRCARDGHRDRRPDSQACADRGREIFPAQTSVRPVLPSRRSSVSPSSRWGWTT